MFYPINSIQHLVNLWLFSFHFTGVGIGDLLLLKWTDFKDDRLYYRMNKNQKFDSLKIPEKAKVILNIYKQESNKQFSFSRFRKY